MISEAVVREFVAPVFLLLLNLRGVVLDQLDFVFILICPVFQVYITSTDALFVLKFENRRVDRRIEVHPPGVEDLFHLVFLIDERGLYDQV